MHVLIADDNEANRLIARSVLEREGHRVTLATSGLDALSLAETIHFDAVLLDIMMPGLDGIRTVRRLKSLSGAALPVFALTSYDTPADVARYKMAGFDGVIGKPLRAGDLGFALSRQNDGTGGRARPVVLAKDAGGLSGLADLPRLDPEIIAGIGASDPDLKLKIYRRYRASLADTVREIWGAVPQCEAGTPEAIDGFRAAIHGLRSASLMMGMVRLPAMAAVLRNAPTHELAGIVLDVFTELKASLTALEAALGLSQPEARARQTPESSVTPRQDGIVVQMGR